MGKQSRLKRARRVKSSEPLQKRASIASRSARGDDEDLLHRASQLEDLFSHYDACDAFVAIGISELWLPNISSPAKHCFALCVFASMAPSRFVAGVRIDTYATFSNFMGKVYALLPDFPMIEDYVPELDWGDVKVETKGALCRMFYGCALEGVADYVSAFKLRNAATIAALDDMHVALVLQDHIISAVDQSLVGDAQDIRSGHIETPTEPFWGKCRDALMSAWESLHFSRGPSPNLIVKQGSTLRSATWSSFGDDFLTGHALPAMWIEIAGARYPLSPRNAHVTVIDHWASLTDDASAAPDAEASASVAAFLRQRFDDHSLFAGPFHLVTREARLPHRFAAAFLSKQKFLFVVVLHEKSLSLLTDIKRDLHNLVTKGEAWGIAPDDGRHAVQFQHPNGNLPGPDEIVLIAVLARVASQFFIRLPKTDSRVFLLPDFVAIFDSLTEVAELERFWSFIDSNRSILGPMPNSMTNLFGAFRGSHGLLVDGAITPNLISLFPHWGSNWRYGQLAEFWKWAPPLFPDDTGAAWIVEPPHDGLQRLTAKGSPSLSWCTVLGGCVLHYVFQLAEQDLNKHNWRMLETFVQCLADAVSQRSDVLKNLPMFAARRIVTICRANESLLASQVGGSDEQTLTAPLLSGWDRTINDDPSTISVKVQVNVARVQGSLTDATDATFEVACASEWVTGLGLTVGSHVDPAVLRRLQESGARKPRFTVSQIRREIELPEFLNPKVPKPEQYKRARKDLAVTFRNLGASPGRYELSVAKAVIDPARDAFRQFVHSQIAELDRDSLLVFCIEQYDALTEEYEREVLRLQQSLAQEVSYDRSHALADAQEKQAGETRNYRYLLECSLSAPASGTCQATEHIVVGLIASIDWLFVLYNASDTLHNGIDVAGVILDESFIPTIFYSSDRDKQERQFHLELAGYNLGLDLVPADEVHSADTAGTDRERLDWAFLKDAGFSLSRLSQTLVVLARWQTTHGETEISLSYRASPSDIVNVLIEQIEGLTPDAADRLVQFATLEPGMVRRLLGKTIDESDVPVWEHTKRGSRYAIRPLVPLGNGMLAWGVAATNRAYQIWTTFIANGYLPADFAWPNVKEVVREIKNKLEKQLEKRAFEVCSRAATHSLPAVDFRSRFPKERFPDVGDFDVLAYWPRSNQWLIVECKYNQPPFCLKDARRLREYIFGLGEERGQLAKIERRRDFLNAHVDKLRELLGWPAPETKAATFIVEIYVSRDIYWWMRNTPYEVPTHFVRIDALDSWLRARGMSAL